VAAALPHLFYEGDAGGRRIIMERDVGARAGKRDPTSIHNTVRGCVAAVCGSRYFGAGLPGVYNGLLHPSPFGTDMEVWGSGS